MQKTIKDLFIDELHDILSSEEQIVKALPKVIEAAKSIELKDAYKAHLQETKGQIKRLEKVFKLLKLAPKEKFCKGTKGLIDECKEVIEEFNKSPVRDAALIAKTQRIEHYEISAYGTVCTFAKELGFKEIAHILHETLVEEVHADKKLTKIAEGGFLTTGINHEANLVKDVTEEKKIAAKRTLVKTSKKKQPSHKPLTKKAAGHKTSVHPKTLGSKAIAKVKGVKKTTIKTLKRTISAH